MGGIVVLDRPTLVTVLSLRAALLSAPGFSRQLLRVRVMSRKASRTRQARPDFYDRQHKKAGAMRRPFSFQILVGGPRI